MAPAHQIAVELAIVYPFVLTLAGACLLGRRRDPEGDPQK